MEIISRELLGAILNKEIIDQPITLRSNPRHWKKNRELCYNGVETVSTPKLMVLAKHWALEKGYHIKVKYVPFSTSATNEKPNCIPVIREIGDLALGNKSYTEEYQAVFKACQIILDREVGNVSNA